jgi:hypothetical protein
MSTRPRLGVQAISRRRRAPTDKRRPRLVVLALSYAVYLAERGDDFRAWLAYMAEEPEPLPSEPNYGVHDNRAAAAVGSAVRGERGGERRSAVVRRPGRGVPSLEGLRKVVKDAELSAG